MSSASDISPLSTHVLNTGDGVPAQRMTLSLHRLEPRITVWSLVTVGSTNEDGRCPGLISRDAFTPGMYKMRFETQQYWESLDHLHNNRRGSEASCAAADQQILLQHIQRQLR